MITRADRIRWSDIRARITQGERVPDADYHFFRSKEAAIRAINSCGLARSCRHWRRVGNKSNPVFDARALPGDSTGRATAKAICADHNAALAARKGSK